MDGAGVGCERLRKRRNIVPFVSLQVVRLHAGQVACLVPPSNDVKVFIQTTRKETRPPGGQSVEMGQGLKKKKATQPNSYSTL